MENIESFLNKKPDGFLIVGIGASAGGIQALKEFFQQVPADSGIAYVVILHLSPDHDSQLAQVLQSATAIPVEKVTEKVKIEPDNVYVVPPNQHLVMQDGYIVPLANLSTEDRRAPVDIFFRHLADTHGPRAVAVILSGTGANGSMGIKRVKELGGVAFVQNPREAEFNEMPRNSIATELIDEVLPVAEIPRAIITYRNNIGAVQITVEPEKRPEQQQQALREIFTQLRIRTGHDFSNYKRPTLLRRIERRVNIHNLPDLPAYSAVLKESPDETTALMKDLLISVTNFFRDKKAFQLIEQDIIPSIIHGKKLGDQVRVWVAGCATGEEAYSIAMLFAERTLGTVDTPNVQIFATDIDETAIAVAREGFYTINDAADVSPDRLRRFFNKEDDGYRLRREVREMVLFANHNFLKDPPFSRLDLITCRNVLIYLNHTAQERVMETFHFALKSAGFLFLGGSESVDGASDLYATYNRENHIYRAREVTSKNYPVPETVPKFLFPPNASQPANEKEARSPRRSSFGELHQKLLEAYAPPSVVVNEEYEIVHMSEKAGKYLEFSAGEPTRNLLKLVRPEIRLELRSALYRAVQKQTAVEAPDVKINIDNRVQSINLHIRPVLNAASTARGFILVIFEQNEEVEDGLPVMISSDEPVVKQLEEELNRLKAQLRNSNEEHEYQAEELKAANEELQAMNEELRSSAEELETSKEELQSINEELRTVNQELKVKIEETSSTSNNLQNLINSVDIGTIFLDRSLGIRMFTPAVRDIFNLIPSDHGRPISDITNKLDYPNLIDDAETVLEKLTVVEREVTTSDNRYFMMRMLPYRTTEDRINGVVVTFFDITRRRQAEQALRQSEERLRLLIESANDYAILTQDTDRRVRTWSSGAAAMLGFTEQEIVGKSGDIMFIPQDREIKAPEREAETAEREGRAENERWHVRKDGSRFWASGVTSPIRDNDGKLVGFVKIMRDLTERRRLEESRFFLASIVESSTDSIVTIDLERRITSWNKAAEKLYGYAAEEAIGKNLTMLTLDEDFLLIANMVDKIEHRKEVEVFDTVRTNKDGRQLDLEIVMSPVQNASGQVIGISTIARDITDRKRRELNSAFLADINMDFAPFLTVDEVMRLVGERLADYLQLSRCHISLVNEEADSLEVIYEWRRDEHWGSLLGLNRISDSLSEEGRQYYSNGESAVMNLLEDSPLINTSKWRELSGFGSIIEVPQHQDGRWSFLLTVARSEIRNWREDEVDLVREVTSRIFIRVQRARTENVIRQSEERFRTLSNAIPQIIWTSDSRGNSNYFNERWYKFSGLSYEQSVGAGWQNIVHPDDAATSVEKWQKALAEGKTFETEYRLRQATGEYRWFIGGNVPLKDDSGNVVGWFGSATDIGALKEAEAVLRRSEHRLQRMVNIPIIGVLTFDYQGKMLHVNDSFLQMVGYDRDEFEAQKFTWKDFTPQEHMDASNHVMQQLRETGRGGPYEKEYFRKDGSRIWLMFVSADLEDGTIVEYAINISDHKKAEDALRGSEKRFRTLTDAIPQIIWSNDGQGKANYFNQRWYEYSGLSYEESFAVGWEAIVHPEDAPATVEKWKQALTAGEVFDVEYRLRSQDGVYRWFIGRNVPLKDDAGKVTSWFGSATDIEDLKKAEEGLSQSEARLKITMESATDYAIITMDTERRVERWSSGASQIFGYTESEVIGQSADIIFTKEDRKAGAPQKEMESARDNGRAIDERWHRRKDGSRFFLSGVMRPINNHHLSGYVKVARDMTQQQLFTEELHRLVEERTRELQQSNNDLQQFAHVASHDLKEPVRKIKTFNNRIRDDFNELLPPKVQMYLNKINSATDRMYAMIEGVLNYSKLGKAEEALKPVDLNKILETIQSDLEVLISTKDAVITTTDLPTITANETLIYQLFYNLILNSLKFSKADEPSRINITCAFEEHDQKDCVKIIFSDNGIGFEQEFAESIFDTFTRLNSADEYEGTGLGLALCKKIVERHGGSISATSELDKGATFTILLPLS